MADFILETKKKKEYEQFTCRIEADLLEKIKRIVLDNNLNSVNEFINDCLRFSIDNLKILEDNSKTWLTTRWLRRNTVIKDEDSDLH